MTGTIQGGAINVNQGSGNGNWQGQVVGNFIGNAGRDMLRCYAVIGHPNGKPLTRA